jgi:hypothetical protein
VQLKEADMSTPPAQQHETALAKQRRRIAEHTAAHLHQTAIYTLHPRASTRPYLNVADWPILQRILTQAPQVAAADPAAVRVGHSPTGRVTVIVVHGPDWSLIASGGRPVPDTLLAVMDDFPRDHAFNDDFDAHEPGGWNIRDPEWLPDITNMIDAIHRAIAKKPAVITARAGFAPVADLAAPQPNPGRRPAHPTPTPPEQQRS